MKAAYITADEIGIETGGGLVTHQEREALRSVFPTVMTFHPEDRHADPFVQDKSVANMIGGPLNLAHAYAGCFTDTMRRARAIEHCKITYTCAAHDIDVSREEHQKLGIPFNYAHLNQPILWQHYSAGYREADVLICPSTVARDTCRKQGAANRIEVIPHGCEMPEVVKPLPKMFTVGYLGAVGADKGLIYLLEAWGRLKLNDAVLMLAGGQTNRLLPILRGGNVNILGWVKHPRQLYDACSIYIQPSATEGFGCEVLEAMAHGRAALASSGAGASDVATASFQARSPEAIMEMILNYKKMPREQLTDIGSLSRVTAERHTWDKIRRRYADLWKSL